MVERFPKWVFILLLVVLCGLYINRQVMPLTDDLGYGVVGIASNQNDFKHLYLGSVLLQEGVSPYPIENMLPVAGQYSETVDPRFRTILPYVYLPFTGLLMAPLTWFSFPNAVVMFQMFNHLALFGAFFFMLTGLGKEKSLSYWMILLIMAVFNYSLYRQNNAGQLNVILLLGYSAVFCGISRSWPPWVIGLIAATIALFKITPGILIIYFLLSRRWKEAAFMAGFGVLLLAITLGFYGIDSHKDFLSLLPQMGYGKSTWPDYHTFWRDAYNLSPNSFFHRLMVNHDNIKALVGGSAFVANVLSIICSLLLIGGLGFLSWKYCSDSKDDSMILFALTICASLLIPSIMWDHYLVQMILPLILLVYLCFERGSVVILLFGIFSIILMGIPLRLNKFSPENGFGVLMLNLKTLAVLVPMFCLIILREKKTMMSDGDEDDKAEMQLD